MPKHPRVKVTDQFGALTVLAAAPQRGIHKFWLCRCKCGVEKEVRNDQLAQGIQTSCGCKFEARKKISTTMLARTAAERSASGRAGAMARWGGDDAGQAIGDIPPKELAG